MTSLNTIYESSKTEDDRVVLEWEDINYYVQVKDPANSTLFKSAVKNNQILNSCSGRAESGQLLAIMGPTGCGKTSLLNILAARLPSSGGANIKLTGKVFVNGTERDESVFRKQSAYVLQDDRLYPHLTVFETVLLAAHFYLPSSISDEKKVDLVRDVISELGLVKATDTIIGDEKVRGVSGGERKRANIATQLIANPAILFLDEPTSGLDAFQAQSVMECLKSLAQHSRLVVSVIHQPRSSIFVMFDRLLLLSCGHVAYMGPADQAHSWFDSQGFPCPKLFNPADFFLDVLSPDTRTPELDAESNRKIKFLADSWKSKQTSVEKVQSSSVKPSQATSNISTEWNFLKKFKLLLWRSFTEQTREIPTLVAKFGISSFFALIMGGIYSNAGYTQTSIQNRTGLLFVVCINTGFNNVTGVLNSFPKEKIIVNRERGANAYDSITYFCAKYIAELPINILPSVVYSIIIYWMVGLNPDTFGYFILIMMLMALCGISLGLAVSALTPSVEAALGLGPPLVIIAILFGGFYININSLPIVANWIPFVSFLRWGFESLCLNEFTGEEFTCSGGTQRACETTGEQVLKRLSFGGKVTGDAVLGLAMLFVGFTLAALFFLEKSKITYISLGHIGSNHRREV